MAKIAKEMDDVSEGNNFAYIKPENMSMSGNIGYGVCALEYAIGESSVACINDFSVAKSISNFRPNTQILFFTNNYKDYNMAAMHYGIQPIYLSTNITAQECINYIISHKLIKRKTNIILVGNNTIKVAQL